MSKVAAGWSKARAGVEPITRRVSTKATSPLTIGSFTFNPDHFGDTPSESDGGTYRQQNWLNVVNADPRNPAALTKPPMQT